MIKEGKLELLASEINQIERNYKEEEHRVGHFIKSIDEIYPNILVICAHCNKDKDGFSKKTKPMLEEGESAMPLSGVVISILRYNEIICSKCEVNRGYLDDWRQGKYRKVVTSEQIKDVALKCAKYLKKEKLDISDDYIYLSAASLQL